MIICLGALYCHSMQAALYYLVSGPLSIYDLSNYLLCLHLIVSSWNVNLIAVLKLATHQFAMIDLSDHLHCLRFIVRRWIVEVIALLAWRHYKFTIYPVIYFIVSKWNVNVIAVLFLATLSIYDYRYILLFTFFALYCQQVTRQYFRGVGFGDTINLWLFSCFLLLSAGETSICSWYRFWRHLSIYDYRYILLFTFFTLLKKSKVSRWNVNVFVVLVGDTTNLRLFTSVTRYCFTLVTFTSSRQVKRQ